MVNRSENRVRGQRSEVSYQRLHVVKDLDDAGIVDFIMAQIYNAEEFTIYEMLDVFICGQVVMGHL